MIALEIFITGLIIALSGTFLVDYCNPYQWVLSRLGLQSTKPFSCSLCMSFWMSVILTIFLYTSILWITLPLLVGMLQIIVSRLIGLLPITFND